mgnify:CR=1 FL=1
MKHIAGISVIFMQYNQNVIHIVYILYIKQHLIKSILLIIYNTYFNQFLFGDRKTFRFSIK